MQNLAERARDIWTSDSPVFLLGDGSMNTAIATVLGRIHPHRPIYLGSRSQDRVDKMRSGGINPDYLHDVQLPAAIEPVVYPCEELRTSRLIISAIPVQQLRGVVRSLKDFVDGATLWLDAAKGIERDTHALVHTILADELSDSVRSEQIAKFTGPSFAQEMVEGEPTGVMIAAQDLRLAQELCRLFSGSTVDAYPSNDLVGAELVGALKNVVVIFMGILHGLGYRRNARSMWLTHGLSEMRALGIAMGARRNTFESIAAVGDLDLSNDPESRNFSWWNDVVVQGKNHATYEGMATAQSFAALAKQYAVPAPMANATHDIISFANDKKQAPVVAYAREVIAKLFSKRHPLAT